MLTWQCTKDSFDSIHTAARLPVWKTQPWNVKVSITKSLWRNVINLFSLREVWLSWLILLLRFSRRLLCNGWNQFHWHCGNLINNQWVACRNELSCNETTIESKLSNLPCVIWIISQNYNCLSSGECFERVERELTLGSRWRRIGAYTSTGQLIAIQTTIPCFTT